MTIASTVARSETRQRMQRMAAERNERIVSDLYALARRHDLTVLTLFRIWRAVERARG